MTIGWGGDGSGTWEAACSKSWIAGRNPAAWSREVAVYVPLSIGCGRTTMLDSGNVTSTTALANKSSPTTVVFAPLP